MTEVRPDNYAEIVAEYETEMRRVLLQENKKNEALQELSDNVTSLSRPD